MMSLPICWRPLKLLNFWPFENWIWMLIDLFFSQLVALSCFLYKTLSLNARRKRSLDKLERSRRTRKIWIECTYGIWKSKRPNGAGAEGVGEEGKDGEGGLARIPKRKTRPIKKFQIRRSKSLRTRIWKQRVQTRPQHHQRQNKPAQAAQTRQAQARQAPGFGGRCPAKGLCFSHQSLRKFEECKATWPLTVTRW